MSGQSTYRRARQKKSGPTEIAYRPEPSNSSQAVQNMPAETPEQVALRERQRHKHEYEVALGRSWQQVQKARSRRDFLRDELEKARAEEAAALQEWEAIREERKQEEMEERKAAQSEKTNRREAALQRKRDDDKALGVRRPARHPTSLDAPRKRRSRKKYC